MRIIRSFICTVIFALLFSTMVYADGADVVYVCDAGRDENDGLSAANAVKTLEKAIEKLDNQKGTIVVCGELTITDQNTAIESGGGNDYWKR